MRGGERRLLLPQAACSVGQAAFFVQTPVIQKMKRVMFAGAALAAGVSVGVVFWC